MFPWRNIVVYALIAILPVSLSAQEASATLRSVRAVTVNGNTVPPIITVVQNDSIQTPKDGTAVLQLQGSSAEIGPDTLLTFDGDELVLDHGTITVNTSRFLRVRVGCIKVVPVNSNWTQYQVVDVDTKVKVSAFKDDVYIEARERKVKEAAQNEHSNRTIVHEGEQKTRDEHCAAGVIPPAQPEVVGPLLNSPYAIGAGAVAIGAIMCLGVFCQNGNPASPSKP